MNIFAQSSPQSCQEIVSISLSPFYNFHEEQKYSNEYGSSELQINSSLN
jgi:hypothetical protein